MTHSNRHEITRKRVLYDLPGTETTTVRPGVEYMSTLAGTHTLDLYHPSSWRAGVTAPAVIFVSGLSDIGAQQAIGCRINEMASSTSWARLVAASGMAAVTYTTGMDPADDTRRVIEYLHEHGETIGIDAARLALWACSSHVPNALGQLIDHRPLTFRSAVLSYGFMLDLDGSTDVHEAGRRWRFANPAAGKTVRDLPDVPIFIARAGRDTNAGVNESIDRFLTHALKHNRPVTLVNHHDGAHAFDLEDNSETTRRIVRQMLAFLRSTLIDTVKAHNSK